MNEPLVSICCLSYNHAKYLVECLEGFVNQKTNFLFEVLIHDDASTDDSQEIIKEYQAKYPDIINPIFQTENQYSKGVSITWTYNYPRSKGKYIALCEGDDYWTDPYKLQKQVDFLEANDSYIATTSNTYYLKNGKTDYTYIGSKELWLNRKMKNEVKYNDIPARLFPHTSSWLFRNGNFLDKFDFTNFIVGDMALFMILCHYGKVNYSPDIMSVYRVHNKGAIADLSKKNEMLILQDFAKMYKYIDETLNIINKNQVSKFIIDDHIRYIKGKPQLSSLSKCIKNLNNLDEISHLVKFSLLNRLYIEYVFLRYFSVQKLKKIKSIVTFR